MYFPAFSVIITMLEAEMKKFIITLLFLTVFAIGVPLFAQSIAPEHSSDYYYVNVHLEKIYPTRFGYLLMYRKGVNELGRVAVPNEWFTSAGSKSELITLPKGKNWPSVTIFYKNGEFSHLRLYVHPSRAHSTWGNVPLNADVAGYFENVTTIQIEY